VDRATGATEPNPAAEPALGSPGCSQGSPGWTRFAPAPTGYLHLGQVANAIYVWGMAAATNLGVLLRIEDHDRERSRGVYADAILEDLAWLGFVPDMGPVYQREDAAPYVAAVDRLRLAGLVYACDCTRSTFASWAATHGQVWVGGGCPGGCRERLLDEDEGTTLRVALGDGQEAWSDRLLGARSGDVALAGDLPVRDRHGNWTYPLCVVVDDLRQSIMLVVRGEDLAEATPAQIRVGRLLGRIDPPAFAHHPLIRKPDGAKRSTSDGDTGVRELRAAGRSSSEIIGEAATMVGLIGGQQSISAADVVALPAFALA
jgi:glutamyl/glutaminyl-tRNA synthetase